MSSASFTTSKMAVRHEQDVAELLTGRQTKASGSGWQDKTDGKHNPDVVPYAFAWDCKATLAKSASVSLATWAKLEDQSDDLLPALPLRFYGDTRLTLVNLDLIVLRLDHFAEILEEANLMARIRDSGCLSGTHAPPEGYDPDGEDVELSCSVCGERV